MPERFVTTHAAKHQHSWWDGLMGRTTLQATLLLAFFISVIKFTSLSVLVLCLTLRWP